MMGLLKRWFGRDDNHEQGNARGGEREALRERIRHREDSAIDTLARRREREAEVYAQRAEREGKEELRPLAEQSRKEAERIRKLRGADLSEHEDLLRALGFDGENI